MSKKSKPTGRQPDPNSKRSQGVDRHVGRRIVVYIDPADFALLDEHMSEQPVELKISAIVRRAIRMYLESVGKWPPGDQLKK